MPIQTDSKVFPHLSPPTPTTDEELLAWARQTSKALDELMRQVVDKYNLHLTNTEAHPNAWKTLKVRRPSLTSVSGSTNLCRCKASTTDPQRFVINNVAYEASSDIDMNLNVSGVGGLRSGLTKASATIYYIYAVLNGTSVALIGDTNAPTTGPTGYTAWSYIGSVSTLSGSAAFPAFKVEDGMTIHSAPISSDLSETSGSFTAKTLNIPVNASFVIGMLFISSVTAGTVIGDISSSSTGGSILHSETNAVATTRGFNNGTIPIETAQTIYLKIGSGTGTVNFRVLGWIEDPTRFA